MLLLLILLALSSPSAKAELAEFTTDGCSAFLDRPLFTRSHSWAHCCVNHDLAYWQGGTLPQRERADDELFSCVVDALGGDGATLPSWIWFGVKIGGAPYGARNPFAWRWGYGWSQSGYKNLSAEEKLQVAEKLSHVYQNMPRISEELELSEIQQLQISAELYLQIVRFERPHRIR